MKQRTNKALTRMEPKASGPFAEMTCNLVFPDSWQMTPAERRAEFAKERAADAPAVVDNVARAIELLTPLVAEQETARWEAENKTEAEALYQQQRIQLVIRYQTLTLLTETKYLKEGYPELARLLVLPDVVEFYAHKVPAQVGKTYDGIDMLNERETTTPFMSEVNIRWFIHPATVLTALEERCDASPVEAEIVAVEPIEAPAPPLVTPEPQQAPEREKTSIEETLEFLAALGIRSNSVCDAIGMKQASWSNKAKGRESFSPAQEKAIINHLFHVHEKLTHFLATKSTK